MSDPFEELLSAQSMREPVAEWKAEILTHARAPQRRNISPLWIAMAACWLLIGGLTMVTPDTGGDGGMVGADTPLDRERQLSSLHLVAALTQHTELND